MPEVGTGSPRVSVVMSVYNDAEHVERAVRSVLEQTFRDLELIAINDGSSDGSGEVLDRLAAMDSRVQVIHQENSGLTRALIRACSKARGEFVARQDSDDWSHPLRIAEQVALLERNDRVGFVSCATQYVGPGDEHLTVITRPTDPETATRDLLEHRKGPTAHGSVMFRRELYERVGGYRSEFHFSQDSDLWLRMGEQTLIGYVAEVRYTHRKDAHSISGARRALQSEFARLAHACRNARISGASEKGTLSSAAELGSEIGRGNHRATLKNDVGRIEISYLIGSQLVRNSDARARRYLWGVISKRPWHARAWVRLLQSWVNSK